MAFSSQKNFVHIPFTDEIDRLGCTARPETALTKYDQTVDNRTWSMDKEQFSQYLSYLVTCKVVTACAGGGKKLEPKRSASSCSCKKKPPCKSKSSCSPCKAEKEDSPEMDPNIADGICDKVKVLVKCGKVCPAHACEIARMCKRLGEFCDQYGIQPIPKTPCENTCDLKKKADCYLKQYEEAHCKFMKQCDISKKLDCKIKEMCKELQKTLNELTMTKRIYQDQIKEQRDEISRLKAKLAKMNCIELENQALNDEKHELEGRIKLFDCQFNQLKNKTATFKCNGYRFSKG